MQRPIDSRSNPGLSYRMADQTVSKAPTSMPSVFKGRDGVSQNRDQTNIIERRDLTSGNWNRERIPNFQHFLVPKKDGGHRPITNLKKLNEFIPHHHFKMEGIHMLKDLLRQGDYMAKIELKDAYLSVTIISGYKI